MTKLDWKRAQKSRPTDSANPGSKPRRRVIDVDNWDDLERLAIGPEGPPMMRARTVSAAEIEASKTPKGAWTRVTLAGWGVSWPPPRGWKAALIAGVPIEQGAALVDPAPPPRESVRESLEAKLLHDLMMAVTNTGMAHLLADLPDILAYFGSELPTVAEVINCRQMSEMITGEITLEDRVWSFTCARIRRAA